MIQNELKLNLTINFSSLKLIIHLIYNQKYKIKLKFRKMAFEQYPIKHSDLPSQKASLLKNQKEWGFSFTLLISKLFCFSNPPCKKPSSKDDPTFRVNKKQTPDPDDSKTSLFSPFKTGNGSQPFFDAMAKIPEALQISDAKEFILKEDNFLNSKFNQFTNENSQFGKAKNLLERNQIMGLDEKVEEMEQDSRTFLMKLSSNQQYLSLNYALELFSESQMENAKVLLQQIETQCLKKIEELKKTNNYRVEMFILVQSICYQAQVERCLGEQMKAVQQLFQFNQKRLLEKCLSEYRISEPEVLGQIYLEIAQNYFQKLYLNRAMDYFHKALIFYERLNWQHQIPLVLKYIAYISAIFNQFNDAKTIAYSALEMAQKQKPPDFDLISSIYYVIGFTFYYNKEYDFAIEYLELCNELITKNLGENHVSLSRTFNLLGVIYQLQTNSSSAIENYLKAIKFYGQNDQCLISVAQIYNNLGIAYAEEGDLEAADEAFCFGMRIYSEFYSQSHPLVKRIEKNRFSLQSISS